MQFPKLREVRTTRETLAVFGGYNAQPRIGAGEWSDMENLTSDAYPLLAPRRPRGLFAWPDAVRGLIDKDGLCYVDGADFVIRGERVPMGLSDSPKRMVSMGAYVIIFPDKKYINTLSLSDFGSLEAGITASAVVCTPSDAAGEPLLPDFIQPEAPEAPENMVLWLDTSVQPAALLQWSAGSAMWVDVEEVYVTLCAPGIGQDFREGDGVTLEGAPEGIAAQNVVAARGEDFLVVGGRLEQEQTAAQITVSRSLPEMDYVIECGNRLWGCRYGLNAAGEPVNEIYASKLGDFRNWNCFQGITTDSYFLSLGEDGPFTGAVQHMGYPVFFRENCLHKIYGNYPANYRLQTTPCRGVQAGSGDSLAIVGEVLFYKSADGICAYDGALPVEVSQELGRTRYRNAVAGSHGGKYYISMADAGGEYHLFVLDTARNLWHREDGTRVTAFCSSGEELYFLDDSGKIQSVFGTGEPEEPVTWMAQTGDLGLDSPDGKYLAKLTLRLWMEKNAEVRILVRYDSEPDWQTAALIRAKPMGSVMVPFGVRRCDHLRLRLEGRGRVELYSITKTIAEGSDVC